MSESALEIVPNANALSKMAAAHFGMAVEKAVAARNRAVVVLSGGSKPRGMFKLLSRPPYRDALPWDRLHFFWGDERLVPPDAEGSNYAIAHRLLLRKVNVRQANIHRAKGELDPETAVADYVAQLRQVAENGRAWPRFDLAVMGLGSDGHTASLFPGSPAEVSQPVMAVTADYDNRPGQRLTLTPPVFNDARHVLFLVSGQSKATALKAVLHGPPAPKNWPAQRIRPHDGKLTWLVDEDAAALLDE